MNTILEDYREKEEKLKGNKALSLIRGNKDFYPKCIELETNLLSGPCSVNKTNCNKCAKKYQGNIETLLNTEFKSDYC